MPIYDIGAKAHLRVAELLLDEVDCEVLLLGVEHINKAIIVAIRRLYDANTVPYRGDWGVRELVANGQFIQGGAQASLGLFDTYAKELATLRVELREFHDSGASARSLETLHAAVRSEVDMLEKYIAQAALQQSGPSAGSRRLNFGD